MTTILRRVPETRVRDTKPALEFSQNFAIYVRMAYRSFTKPAVSVRRVANLGTAAFGIRSGKGIATWIRWHCSTKANGKLVTLLHGQCRSGAPTRHKLPRVLETIKTRTIQVSETNNYIVVGNGEIGIHKNASVPLLIDRLGQAVGIGPEPTVPDERVSPSSHKNVVVNVVVKDPVSVGWIVAHQRIPQITVHIKVGSPKDVTLVWFAVDEHKTELTGVGVLVNGHNAGFAAEGKIGAPIRSMAVVVKLFDCLCCGNGAHSSEVDFGAVSFLKKPETNVAALSTDGTAGKCQRIEKEQVGVKG